MDSDFQRLSIAVVPCNARRTELAFLEEPIGEECVPDLQAQIDYLGAVQFMIYFNTERFDRTKYGAEAIVKESNIVTQQVDHRVPNWIQTYVEINELEDETAWI